MFKNSKETFIFSSFLWKIRIFLGRVYLRWLKILFVFKINKIKKNNKGRFIVKKINDLKMWLDINDEGISTQLLVKGIREPFSTNCIKKEIHPGYICFDIGANIGYYALLEAKLVGEKGKIYAIEPVSENVDLLKKNIRLNHFSNIEVFECAIGSTNGKGVIYLSKSSNLHSMQQTKNSSGDQREISIFTLDSFMNDKLTPDFIRMDVEGFEVEIIKGMSKILQSQKPLKILIEIHNNIIKEKSVDLLETLLDANFYIKFIAKEPLIYLADKSDVFRTGVEYFLNDNMKSYKNFNLKITDILNNEKMLSFFLNGGAFEVLFVRV